jgi:predicted CoA-binding protein
MEFAVDESQQAQAEDNEWQERIVEDRARIAEILRETKRIAVLGIKTEESGQPAYYVALDAQRRGYEIIPVPVYYPECTEILGEPVYRSVAAIPERVDMVNVFRRPRDIPPHVDDIIAAKPRFVWFQLGIRNDEAAERMARAGIEVVQDRCLSIEFARAGR